MRDKALRHGFTLIETLISMMILSVSLVVILQLFSGGLKAGRLSETYTQAVFHAREKMEEILLAQELTPETLEGEFSDNFKWNAEIVLLEPPEEEEMKLPFDMFNISVEIRWDEGEHEKHINISTLKIADKKKDKEGLNKKER